ncbi:GNAT family N-acetyltransferase [Salinibacillus xinjiangensis]|uniref:GNAT family N-acetyltransferase n=1 Tax=Salinibacillus xinjiangensis TaxID=1229268 RepID=A0A6G1XAD5_9BACI|nr:GNAT family N-acetyltransferase [Salinibacillus xinjiangensis]MRG87840.1 GNAT family N-acetyltransferase [Salinibacillus xinjiangensis]
MSLSIQEMKQSMAKTILSWKYEQPYDFYNNEETEEALQELLDGSYFAIMNETGNLFGFYCVGKSAQVPPGRPFGVYQNRAVDIGFGMNPTHTGKGKGVEFCTFILQQIEDQHQGIPLRLTVATFNQRAIHLYEKLGFRKENKFETDVAKFITMVKKGR